MYSERLLSMDKLIRKYLGHDVLMENGIELQLKSDNPRLLGAKYFSMLKNKNFNIEMSGDDGATAILKISTINDLINLMKTVERDIVFEKNGDVIKIK